MGGAHSVFKKQENFRKIPSRANHSFIQSLLLEKDLIQSLNGLVLIGTDAEMREIADGSIATTLGLERDQFIQIVFELCVFVPAEFQPI